MRLRADTVWYVYEAVDSFLGVLVFTVTAYFFVTELEMSPLQLVLVGTAMELAVFVFEVPTGIVADMRSRRLSVVVGEVVMGVAIIVVGLAGGAWTVIAAWALWGFGYTFTSGAHDAWLADEVGDERLNRVYLRGAQVGRVAMLLGIGASVGLALIDLRLPIVLGGIGTIALAGFHALCMPETGFAPLAREQRGAIAQAIHTGRAGVQVVRGRPLLLAILGIAAFYGMWSESYDRLWQAHLIEDVGLPSLGGLDPVVWFGILGVIGVLLSIAVAQPLGKRLEQADTRRLAIALFRLDLLVVAGSLVFALAGQFWIAVVGSYLLYVGREVASPLFSAWLNRSVEDSGVRATVLSITNQADAVGQWTGGPAIGVVGNVFSIRAGLVVGAVAMTPALALYARVIRRA